MKTIKLKPVNRIKYCERCHEDVKIIMKNRNGYCPICDSLGINTKLYTIDNRTTNQREKKYG